MDDEPHSTHIQGELQVKVTEWCASLDGGRIKKWFKLSRGGCSGIAQFRYFTTLGHDLPCLCVFTIIIVDSLRKNMFNKFILNIIWVLFVSRR